MSDLFDGMIMGVSGARGVVGETLIPETACRLAAAFGASLDRGICLVARDSRPSGEAMTAAVASGLSSVGCKPMLCGILPTPGAQVAVEEMGFAGGIVITASHNPSEWNGLKFIGADGCFISKKEVDELYSNARNGSFERTRWDQWVPHTSCSGASRAHLLRIAKSDLVDVETIRMKGFKIVVDNNHGASGPLFREFGAFMDAEMIILGEEPTGRFRHRPEPTPDCLDKLAETVLATEADLGAALDPDGDRLVLCAANGQLLPEEATLPMVSTAVLNFTKGPIVTNLSTSMMVDRVAERVGVSVFRTSVGEAHVVQAMKEHGSVIGGEGNGGAIIPTIHYGRDAAAALGVILSFIATQSSSLHSMWKEIPKYSILKRKVVARDLDWNELLRRIEGYSPGCAVNREDGLKATMADAWVHVRSSNTEPVVRVIAEGASGDEVAELVRAVVGFVAASSRIEGS